MLLKPRTEPDFPLTTQSAEFFNAPAVQGSVLTTESALAMRTTNDKNGLVSSVSFSCSLTLDRRGHSLSREVPGTTTRGVTLWVK